MEELWELRQALAAGDMQAALAIVDEMEEMSRDTLLAETCTMMQEGQQA